MIITNTNPMDQLAEIMRRQADLQLRMGYDFSQFSTADLAAYLRWNVQAAGAELHEVLNEFSWKPWAMGEPWVSRDAALCELNDVMCFVLNMYLALGATATTVNHLHYSKNEVNHRRQDEGYTATGKCETCGRAADEPVGS